MKPQSESAPHRAHSAFRKLVCSGSLALAAVSRAAVSLAALLPAALLPAALLLVALLLGPAAIAPTPAWADDARAAAPASNLPPEEIERQAEAISRSIMSPFCPGRTVSACPNAGPWRDDIRKWVGEGVDALEIKRRLSERVPEHNLAGVPKNRLGWVLPVGLGALALGVLVFLLRYLVSPRTSATGEGPEEPVTSEPAAPAARGKANPNSTASRPNGDDYDARLEQELDTLEQ